MAITTNNKRKKAVAATVAAAAILLAGTFAWTSISQQAKNEAIVDINPGGRLHDDFNGTNKDVYVENFNSETDATAVPIYARIRLDEYMEIGQEAGMKAENASTPKKANAVKGGTFGDTSSWQTYKPSADKLENADNVSSEHWELSWGNTTTDKYYMPTFDKNKDSLAPDINGDYEGTVEGDIVHYDNYKEYKAETDEKTALEYYDWDSNTVWEGPDGVADAPYDKGEHEVEDMEAAKTIPIDDYNVLTMRDTHNAKQISKTADVITMAKWLENPVAGDYWVYDTDGWAYWANPIAPGETTGLFLSGIQMTKVPDDNWYYGINVVGQFATEGDFSGFSRDGNKITDEALELLSVLTGIEDTFTIEGPAKVAAGNTYNYTVAMKKAGVAVSELPQVTWSVEESAASESISLLSDVEGVSIDASSGKLTVTDAAQGGTAFNVVATLEDGTKSTRMVRIGYEELILKSSDKNEVLLPEDGKYYTVVFEGAADPTAFNLEKIQYMQNSSWTIDASQYSYDPKTQTLYVKDNYSWGLHTKFIAYDGTCYECDFLALADLPVAIDLDTGIGTMAEMRVWDGVHYKLQFVEKTDNYSEYNKSTWKYLDVQDVVLEGEYANGTTWDPNTGILYVENINHQVVMTGTLEGRNIVMSGTGYVGNEPMAIDLSEMTLEDGVYTGKLSDSFNNREGNYSFTKDGETLLLRVTEGKTILSDSAIASEEKENGAVMSYLCVPDRNRGETVYITGTNSQGNTYDMVLTLVNHPATIVISRTPSETYITSVPHTITYTVSEIEAALGFDASEATYDYYAIGFSGGAPWTGLTFVEDENDPKTAILTISEDFAFNESYTHDTVYPCLECELGGEDADDNCGVLTIKITESSN